MEPQQPNSPKTRLANSRLLIVFDALLETNSVTEAAQRLQLNKSDVSRQLAQLRQILDDQLFQRTKHGLIPTPKAEALRSVVRSVVEGIDAILNEDAGEPVPRMLVDESWDEPIRAHVSGLTTRPADIPDGIPGPRGLASKFADVGASSPPHRRLAKYCAEVGGGTGHRRPLSVEESQDAMSVILEGQADPVQIGTLFGIIQDRGITAPELAGFVRAARTHMDGGFEGLAGKAAVDLDWPCYISPYDRRAPWFMLAARLVAMDGYRVVLHGSSGSGASGGRHQRGLAQIGVPVATTADEAALMLDADGIVYMPAYALSTQAFRLLGLTPVMGARNPVHDTLPLLNPANSPVMLLGVSHASYRTLHRDTAELLGGPDVTILANVRGAAEMNPFRGGMIHRLVGGRSTDEFVRKMPLPPSNHQPYLTTMEVWRGVWNATFADPMAEATVISTAAAALLALSRDPQATYADMRARAERLWKNRRR